MPPPVVAETRLPAGRLHVWLAVAPELARPGTRSTDVPALRRILGRYLGVAPERVEVRRDGAGKPHVPGPLEIAVSHHGSLLAVALAHEPVGVDVEGPVADELAERMLRRFFPERWRRAAPARRRVEFLRAWTRAEAAVKAIGGSLPSSLPTLRDPACPELPTWVEVDGRRCRAGDWALPTGHRLAVAVAPASGQLALDQRQQAGDVGDDVARQVLDVELDVELGFDRLQEGHESHGADPGDLVQLGRLGDGDLLRQGELVTGDHGDALEQFLSVHGVLSRRGLMGSRRTARG
jgi:hypothetical protein